MEILSVLSDTQGGEQSTAPSRLRLAHVEEECSQVLPLAAAHGEALHVVVPGLHTPVHNNIAGILRRMQPRCLRYLDRLPLRNLRDLHAEQLLGQPKQPFQHLQHSTPSS